MATKHSKNPAKKTKQQLLEAAIKIFATHGFDGASTRMLVREAGVNISAIPYYFGGKGKLYEAVIQHIISVIQNDRAEIITEIRQSLDSGSLSPAKATRLLHDFIKGFTAFLLSKQATPYLAQIIIREQMRPTPVFDILYNEMMLPMHQILTALVAYLTDRPADSDEALLCTHTIFAHMAIFKTHREFVLRRMRWQTYGADETDAIIALILRNTDAIITANRKHGA